MSAHSLRDPDSRIDPWKAAAAEQGFEGEALPSDLPRFTDALSALCGDAEWPARYSLRFGRDPEERAVARGRVELTVHLVCQRCLGDVRIPLDAPMDLALVHNESQEARVPDHLDPVLVEEGVVRPLNLVEDELLLAIPQVPLHAEGDCTPLAPEVPKGPEAARKRDNPFAVLVGLQASPADPGEGGNR